MPRALDLESRPPLNAPTPFPPRLVGGILALGVIIMVVLVSTFGPSAGFPKSLVNVLIGLLTPAPLLAGVYMLAGLGLGTAFLPLCRHMPLARCIAAGAGLATLLTLSHLLGCLGLLRLSPNSPTPDISGIFFAWSPIVAGLVLLVVDFVVRARVSRDPTPSTTSRSPSKLNSSSGSALAPLLATFGHARYRLLWMTTPSLAIMLVVGTYAPGYLWDSEFGGYDALSYHLQLPQEWLMAGVLKPLQHNVYSFLPGYIESAFMHLGAMSFAPGNSTTAQEAISIKSQVASLAVPATGLTAGTGWRLIACQYLHIYFTLFAAYITARLTYTLSAALAGTPATTNTQSPTQTQSGESLHSNNNALLAGCLGFAIVITTPWTLAVGSLAYNEMAMLAFFACAIAATSGALIHRIQAIRGSKSQNEPEHSPIKTTALCAILVGAAVCAKPTALFFCGVPVALLLCFSFPWRAYPKMAAVGVVVGSLMLAPWLIRNAIATKAQASVQAATPSSLNPVFPFAATLFPNSSGGTGHWTSEQVQRFATGHSFKGSILEALALTVRADPNDPMGRTHRGMLHHQWFLFFPVILIGLGIGAFVCPPYMRVLVRILLACMVLQYLMWLTLTHVQSRFLLPLMIPGAIAFALTVSCMPTTRSQRWGSALATLFVVLQATASVAIFASQRNGDPNLLLGFPASWRNAEVSREVFAEDPSQLTSELLMNLPPEQLMALTLEPDAKVTMIGGATPLYMTRATRYNTTWDTWVNLDELAATARTSTSPHYVLVDFSEIARLQRSGIIEPGMDSETITRWLTVNTDVIKAWEDVGTVLARMKP